MYSILVTFSISQVIQALFTAWLWVKLHQKYPHLIEAQPLASAPYYDDTTTHKD